MKTTNFKQYGGLEYVEVKNLPVRTSKELGAIVTAKLGEVERLIAAEILNQHVPLRGQEVEFLRKTLDLSMEKFAGKLGLTSGTILRWEREKKKRLSQINEYAIRGFVAEALALIIPIKFSDLSESSKTPEKLIVDWHLGSQKRMAA
ncbi:hypothetical protein WDW37_02365 [Bdellovibrionota bacterium FG-1]